MTDELKHTVILHNDDYAICKCGAVGENGATCPFSEEIHGRIVECNCCRECCRECAQDI